MASTEVQLQTDLSRQQYAYFQVHTTSKCTYKSYKSGISLYSPMPIHHSPLRSGNNKSAALYSRLYFVGMEVMKIIFMAFHNVAKNATRKSPPPKQQTPLPWHHIWRVPNGPPSKCNAINKGPLGAIFTVSFTKVKDKKWVPSTTYIWRKHLLKWKPSIYFSSIASSVI